MLSSSKTFLKSIAFGYGFAGAATKRDHGVLDEEAMSPTTPAKSWRCMPQSSGNCVRLLLHPPLPTSSGLPNGIGTT